MRPAEWTTACPDWQERIVAGETLVPDEPLFPSEAEDALAVFKSLKVVDVAGQPTFGEICDDWVFDFVSAIFGAYDPVAAERLINEFMLLISKKNFKSTIVAGIALTALIRNWRTSNEVLVLAPTLEVANNCFGPAVGMIRADQELSELLHVVEHKRTIVHRVTHAEMKVVAADSDTAAGKKAAFVIVEELWLFGKRPGAQAMLMEATGGLAARPEGFVLYVTTHSDEPPAGVFKEKLEYFRDVRDGVIADRSVLGVLYEWPEAMLESEAYLDPQNFYVTNPNLVRAGRGDWLAAELAKSMRGEGEGKQVFLAKHLNVEIGMRLRRDRWVGADWWEKRVDPELVSLDDILARSEVVTVGVDGGGGDDLLGLGVIGRERDTKRWLVWAHAWAQPQVFELRKEIAPRLRDFEKARELTECVSPTDDVEGVVEVIVKIRDAGLLPASDAVGFDAWGVGLITDALVAAGFTAGNLGDQLQAVPQGFKLQGAVLAVQRKLMDGTLVHGGGGLLTWAVSNAKSELKGSTVVITKAAAGKAKIDPLMAVFDAAALMMRGPEAQGSRTSVYESRGLVFV